MALTKEEFIKAREAGFSVEQIADFSERMSSAKGVKDMGQITPGKDVPEANTDLAIEKRGKAQDVFGEFKKPGIIPKAVATLKTAGMPFAMFGAGIANPSLEMQKGNFNPVDLGKEFALGISGQKLGRPIDVYRRAGMPSAPASVLDFFATTSPLKAVKMAQKSLGGISRWSDKKIIQAGESLMQATDKATKVSGANLNKVFSEVDNINVDPDTFINTVSKLPKPLVAKLEEAFGSMEDVAQNLNIGKLRQLKQMVGKYKPSAFGKSERGLAENLEAEDINKVYGSIKGLLHKSVREATDNKTAEALIKAENEFTKVSRSADYVKKTIVDSTLREPTKAGSMAQKMIVEGDVSGRSALNTLKKTGARKDINKAVSALEAFNKWQALTQLGQHAANAALFGGAVGGIGGYLASRVYNRND